MAAPEPDDLRALGARIDDIQRRRGARSTQAQPTAAGVAMRFGTELVVALFVGGAMGWGLDWAFGHWSTFHTKPLFTIVLFVLGAAAGIRNVMRAAGEMNAETAAAPAASAVNDDEEN
jgi:ATP synthase protein I